MTAQRRIPSATASQTDWNRQVALAINSASSSVVDLRDWNASPDGSTDYSTILQQAINQGATAGVSIFAPRGVYCSSAQLVIPSGTHLYGEGTSQDSTAVSFPAAYLGTTFFFSAGVGGLKIQYIRSDDASGSANIPGGSGTIIERLRFACAGAGAASAGHYGIDARARCTLRGVEVRGFGDHGIYVRASLSGGDGVVYGNANRTLIENCKSLVNAGDGFYLSGNDTNVSKIDTCHAQNNGGYGFTDDSLIQALWLCCTEEGNTTGGYRTLRTAVCSSFIACETENNTSTRHSIGTSCVIRGGNLEQVTSMPRWQNYSGMTMRSGKTLSLNNTGNTVALSLSNDGTNIASTGPLTTSAYKVSGTQVVGARKTGWTVDTGTAKRTANATYSGTADAAYTQATIQTLMDAVRDVSQTVKALKDDLHGTAGHGLIGT